ncbi:hypothetical protein [Chloroflexus sp.]|uniref:hypothetical protein n=1 Tax=Chloroflexus sp. TaxID=1904827 RepID=UPI002ACEA5D6|nr:hypothetical protein [Chloroflexus sp.]
MPVGIRIPVDDSLRDAFGMMVEAPGTEERQEAPRYRIPPVVWMLVFIVVGYLMVRIALED